MEVRQFVASLGSGIIRWTAAWIHWAAVFSVRQQKKAPPERRLLNRGLKSSM